MHSEMEFKRITLFVLASFFILISFYRGCNLYRCTLVVKHFPKYDCLSSLPSRLSEKSTLVQFARLSGLPFRGFNYTEREVLDLFLQSPYWAPVIVF